MLRPILFLAALLASLTSAAESTAIGAGGIDAGGIDEVVVTATRRAISSEEVSSGLTVLGLSLIHI